jgi:hypothetical protein
MALSSNEAGGVAWSSSGFAASTVKSGRKLGHISLAFSLRLGGWCDRRLTDASDLPSDEL